MANNIKRTIIAMFVVSMVNSILVRDTMAQAVQTPIVTENTPSDNSNHRNPKPSQTTVNHSMTAKPSPSHTIKKPKLQLTSKKQSPVRRCYNSFLKHIWGIGSFKKHCLRRIGVILTSTIAGIAITKKDKAVEPPLVPLVFFRGNRCEHPTNQLVYAAAVGCKQTVRALLKYPVINFVGTSSDPKISFYTPLQVAAKYGHNNIARLLLEKGAILMQNNCIVGTPLHLACKNGKANMVCLLLEARSHVDLCAENCSRTPLMSAEGNPDVIAILLNANANVSLKDGNNMTALHYAAKAPQHRGMKLLLQANADINARDFWGRTPLFIVAQSKVNNCGQSIDDEQTENNRVETIRMLLQHNADPTVTDNNFFGASRTPLDVATNEQAKELLKEHMKQNQVGKE